MLRRWIISGGVYKISSKTKILLGRGDGEHSGVSIRYVVPLLVFLVLLATSLYYWNSARQNLSHVLGAQYRHRVNSISGALDSKLQNFETALGAGSGLLELDDNLSEAGWNDYYQTYELHSRLPSVLGVGFASQTASGSSTDLPITYVTDCYGSQGAMAVGENLLTTQSASQSVEKARDLGSFVLAGDTAMPTSASRNQQPALALYAPVYRLGSQPPSTAADRQQALLGIVYLTADDKIMFGQAFGQNLISNFGVQVYDGGRADATASIYKTANYAAIKTQRGARLGTRQFSFAGHTWLLAFAASPKIVSSNQRDFPIQVLLRGLLASIFFAGLVWYLITNRERKILQAQRQQIQLAKDELLSLASHQLRTPATIVKQYVGMLLQGYGGEITDEQREMLTSAYDNNERQLSIIAELLNVARLDAGRITLHKQLLSINKMLSEVIESQAGAIEAKAQKLVNKLSKKTIQIVADPSYLPMVFENLLSNASKYTPEGGTITLAMKVEKALNRLSISVADTGLGIPQDYLDLIFDKFSRVENENTAAISGSGIGLYLANQIVKLHGGTIEAKSTEGQGSTFTVRLPIKSRDSS